MRTAHRAPRSTLSALEQRIGLTVAWEERGVDYNAHPLESIARHVVPAIGWHSPAAVPAN